MPSDRIVYYIHNILIHISKAYMYARQYIQNQFTELIFLIFPNVHFFIMLLLNYLRTLLKAPREANKKHIPPTHKTYTLYNKT